MTYLNPMRAIRIAAGLLAAIAIALFLASASFAAPARLGNFCHRGEAAGQCTTPRGVATSSLTGHIYLADEGNQRIDEFTAWGEFVRAWGWGVDDGSPELQTCTTETGCREGLSGAGVGEFDGPVGVAVDSAGDVYVVDWRNHRVQKFDSEGHFLLMFGGEVDKGPNHPGNVCTAAFVSEGDTCGAGTTGTAPGQFSASWKGTPVLEPYSGIGIAIDPANQVYVGDRSRIQVFDASGVFQRQLPLPHEGTVGALAVDPNSGNVYMDFPNSHTEFEPPVSNVYRLDQSTGVVLDVVEVDKPTAMAIDGSGRVYVFDNFFGTEENPDKHASRILVFDNTGALIEKFAETARFSPEEILASDGIAIGETCFSAGQEGIYLSEYEIFGPLPSALYAFGPHPDPALCPPPQVPPSLNGQYAATVDATTATLKAEINPHYFTETVGTTTYLVQYGPTACVEAEGWEAACVDAQPIPPAALEVVPTNEDVTTGGVLLSGLSPNTEYTYRFVIEGSGAPGEPVVGVGGEPGVEGASAAFTTMPLPSPPTACPNDAFRSGAGFSLPDCRAYEMVSPVDKDGGDAVSRLNLVPFISRMDQASSSGEALTFSSYRAFQDPKSAPYSSQYLSRRTPAGWGTEAISPPQEGGAFIDQLFPLDNLYRAFTEDLGVSWLYTDTEPVLGIGGIPEHPNIYRRDDGSGVYSACTSAPPQLDDGDTHGPQLQGFSSDGHLAVFRDENKLTSDAPSALRGNGRPIYQLYACSYSGGSATVHLVSVLPNGSASTLENTVGGPSNQRFQLSQGRIESLENAVSSDGSKVFWTASTLEDAVNPGALYVRLNPGAEPTGGTCVASEPEKACTQLISAGPARFWTAAKDGSVAIYSTESGQLNEYEVATKKTHPIASEVLGVAGASSDAKRVYFVSKAVLAGGGVAGEPNLYLHDAAAETTAFIGILSEEDLTQDNHAPGPINPEPAFHTARVTPDGATAVFMSSDAELAELTAGYDNTDQLTGKPAAEIYRYAVGEGLACISCNRTGARPLAREVQNQAPNVAGSPQRPAASLLPPWLNALYAPRVLSQAGSRVFFEAFEPLASGDTNGKADVYEWEQAGTGSCSEADSSFNPRSGGCVTPISSGKAPTDSEFVDASEYGRDVFIRTASSLVPWDPGQIDIYDAREGGGLPAPPSPAGECEGEACQTPPPGPAAVTPASSNPGPGNIKEGSHRKCPKGRHKVHSKGKVRCVKDKKHARGKKHHHTNGRATR